MAKIIIVGAGIAGLACGWRLQTLGHEVELLEAETVPGGRMRSERHGDFVVDRGAQFVASGYRNLLNIANEAGVGGRIRPLARTSNALLRNGSLHPGDYDFPLRFLRSELLSAGAKLRLPRLLFEGWRHRKVLDPLRPELAAAIDSEDMATYLRRVVGDEAFEYLLGPAFSSTFDSDPEDLSGAFALLTLRFVQSGFRLLSFEGGNGLLTRALAGKLRVRTGCTVRQVQAEESVARVRYTDVGGEHVVDADAVVVAVPGSLVSGLCANLTAEERAFFGEVRYVCGIIVYFMLPAVPETLPYYGVAFPRREGLDLYGMAVDHHKPGATPPAAGLLNVAFTATAAARFREVADDRVVELAAENIARTPIGRLRPVDSVVHRWDPMLPQFRAGYLRHLAAFLRRSERSPRLAFAGDYLVGPYTEAALVSGLRAAEDVRGVAGAS